MGGLLRLSIAIFLLIGARAEPAAAWGLATHRFVNEAAIELLPEPLRTHYRQHRELLSDLAVAPDVVLRQRDGQQEARRHYIRLDVYGGRVDELAELGRPEAERRFGRRKVERAGTLPWVILDHAVGIERALRKGDWSKAVRTSGYAGHYLSDGFMPLHTTANHDGQKSPAGRGLHGALERDLLDPSISEVGPRARRRADPASPERFTRRRVLETLRDVATDVAPLIDAHVAAARSGSVGSPAYLETLEPRVLPLLERRLADAVTSVASLWLSSWVAAGRPEPPAR